MTYINHLFKGREWMDIAKLSAVFPSLGSVVKDGLLSSPTNVRYTVDYELPENDGYIHLDLVPGVSADGHNMLQLSITAAGAPTGSDENQIMQWIDKGRYAVVKSFSEFSSTEVQSQVWERL